VIWALAAENRILTKARPLDRPFVGAKNSLKQELRKLVREGALNTEWLLQGTEPPKSAPESLAPCANSPHFLRHSLYCRLRLIAFMLRAAQSAKTFRRKSANEVTRCDLDHF
jgi:hypothetical protein